MNYADLPPLQTNDTMDPTVCDLVQRYLAVWNDLAIEQRQRVSAHVATCARCSQAQHTLQTVTNLLASMESSQPSARVDQAVLAAIAARRARQQLGSSPQARRRSAPRPGTRGPLRLGGLVAAAAVLVFVVLAGTYWMVRPQITVQQQAFVLPVSLSWAGYVFYQRGTRLDKRGQHYSVNVYYDPQSRNTHVETIQDGTLDVVAISDTHTSLGLDKMHRVAQWDADQWMVDESMFDLAQLHRDMQTHHAVYLGTDDFRGQKVYRIRCDNGLVLLLDMHYMPVNVLQGTVGPGTGEPMYDEFKIMKQSSVSESMWEMRVPPGFQIGKLPPAP